MHASLSTYTICSFVSVNQSMNLSATASLSE